MKKITTKEVEILIPIIPNFILTKEEDQQCIPVGEFTEEEIREIGALWTEELVKKTRKLSQI